MLIIDLKHKTCSYFSWNRRNTVSIPMNDLNVRHRTNAQVHGPPATNKRTVPDQKDLTGANNF